MRFYQTPKIRTFEISDISTSDNFNVRIFLWFGMFLLKISAKLKNCKVENIADNGTNSPKKRSGLQMKSTMKRRGHLGYRKNSEEREKLSSNIMYKFRIFTLHFQQVISKFDVVQSIKTVSCKRYFRDTMTQGVVRQKRPNLPKCYL